MGRAARIRNRRKRNGLNTQHTRDIESERQLLNFMKDNKWHNISDLRVKTFSTTGRGIYAKHDVRIDDILIDIPLEAMITAATIESDVEFASCFRELAGYEKIVSFQSLMALYLVFNSMNSSKWDAYIATIPKQFTNPFFCAKEELHHIPNSLLLKIVEQNNKIKSNFTQIQLMLRKESHFSNQLTNDRFKWAYFALNSRSVFISPSQIQSLIKKSKFKRILTDSPSMALAPFLDLFNHSDTAATQPILATKPTPSFKLVTVTPYKRNRQIYISYGPHDNTKLLLDYGFIIPGNIHDTIAITLGDIESYIKTHAILKSRFIPPAKFRYIRLHNLHEQMFLQNTDEISSHNLLIVLTLLIVADRSEFPNEFDQVAFGSVPELGPVVAYLVELIETKMSEFAGYASGLRHIDESTGLSSSGKVVLDYFEECLGLLGKILKNCTQTQKLLK